MSLEQSEKIIDLLNNKVAPLASDFLNWKLPVVGGDSWWDDCVLNKLTDNQKQVVIERNISELNQLDLTALLRLFNQNWHQLNRITRFPPNSRGCIFKMMRIRKNLAHHPLRSVHETNSNQELRALRTILQFLNLIDAPEEIFIEVKNVRSSFVI